MPTSQIITKSTSITITDTTRVLVTPIAVDGDGMYVREIRVMGTTDEADTLATQQVLVVRLMASERANIEVDAPAQLF